MERYFEFKEGTSSKFWAVRRDGASVYTRYGKIGADGQTTVKVEVSDAKAQALMDKLVGEKTRKGYIEQGAAQAAANPTVAKAVAVKAKPASAESPLDLEGARKALKADEPYLAWKRATGGAPSPANPTQEQLEVIVAALESICSDLDEHGSDNMELYGGGKISLKKFFALRDDARSALRKLKNPGSGRPLAALPTSPVAVTLGTPKLLREGENPTPWVTVNGFVSQDDSEKALIVLRSLDDGAVTCSLGDDGQRSVAVSPDGKQVAIGRWDKTVVCFDAKTGKQQFAAKGAGVDWVTSLSYSADGERHAVGSHAVAVLDAKSGKQLALRTFGGDVFDGHPIHALSFAPDGKRVWVLQDDHLKVFDATSLETVSEVEFKAADTLAAIDARRALAGPWGKVGIIDVETSELLESAKVKPYVSRASLNAARTLAAVLTGDKKSSTVTVYGLNPFAPLATVKLPAPADSTISKGGVTFSDHALLVATETKTFWVPLSVK